MKRALIYWGMIFLIIVLLSNKCDAQTHIIRSIEVNGGKNAKASTLTWTKRGIHTEFGLYQITKWDREFKMDSTKNAGRFIVSISEGIDPNGRFCLITRIYHEEDWLDLVIFRHQEYQPIICKIEPESI